MNFRHFLVAASFLTNGIGELWAQTSYSWVPAAVPPANWCSAGSWTPGGGPPDAVDAIALFGTATPAQTVDLNAFCVPTVGTMTFSNSLPYTITPLFMNVIILSASTGNAMINVTSGTGHTINAGLSLSSNLSITSSGSVILAGVISGNFNITIAGNVTLSNPSNSYSTGGSLGTTINSGVVNVVSGALGPGNVVMSGGTLQAAAGGFVSNVGFTLSGPAIFDTALGGVTLSGVMSGSGSLTKINAGTMTLSGTNNVYTGSTTISGGVLNIASDGSLGTSTGSIAIGTATLQAGGTVSSSRAIALTGIAQIDTVATTMTLSGNITGSGSLTKLGTGSLILTGTNTYSGGTTVSAGTLQGNALGLQGSIVNNSALIFNQATIGTYSGALSGGGTLAINGGSLLTMNGNSSGFTGPTTIASGTTLIENGNLSGSAVTVSAGGNLKGSGSVGSVLLNAGQITPGLSGSGTLAINGALSFNPGGSIVAELAPLTNGMLNVTGSATLANGNLLITHVLNVGFFGFSKTYTLLNAGSVIGTFSSVTSSDPNFSVTPIYNSTNVQILHSVLQPFLNFPFANANERSVGNNIDAINVAGTLLPDMAVVINALTGQSDAVIDDALDQMHPAAFSAFAELQSELGGQLLSLFHRKPTLRCSCDASNRFWVEPFGNWLKQKKQGMEIGFDTTSYGVVLGYDRQFWDCWTLGAGFAWNTSDLKWSLGRGYSYIDGFYGAFYTDLILSNFYIGGSVYAGKDWYNTSRLIRFTSVDRQAKSHSHGVDVAGQLTAAYFFGAPMCLLYPYATIDYLYLKNSSFTEGGAGSLDLNIGSYTSTALRSETGVAWEFIDKNKYETICISPLISIGYVLDLPLHRTHYSATFKGQTIPFTTQGWDMAWQLLNLRFGLNLTYRCFTLDSQYIADISPEGGSPFFNQRANFRFSCHF